MKMAINYFTKSQCHSDLLLEYKYDIIHSTV